MNTRIFLLDAYKFVKLPVYASMRIFLIGIVLEKNQWITAQQTNPAQNGVCLRELM